VKIKDIHGNPVREGDRVRVLSSDGKCITGVVRMGWFPVHHTLGKEEYYGAYIEVLSVEGEDAITKYVMQINDRRIPISRSLKLEVVR